MNQKSARSSAGRVVKAGLDEAVRRQERVAALRYIAEALNVIDVTLEHLFAHTQCLDSCEAGRWLKSMHEELQDKMEGLADNLEDAEADADVLRVFRFTTPVPEAPTPLSPRVLRRA